jgi:hypothetical protein
VDQQKLIRLLKDVYGTTSDGHNNFRVEVKYRPLQIYDMADLLIWIVTA